MRSDGVQRRDQGCVVACRFGPCLAESGYDLLDAVNPDQHLADDIWRHGQGLVAKLAKHVFAGMSDAFEPWEAQEPAGALYGVHQPEDETERFGVIRRALQGNQSAVEFSQALVRLGQKVGKQIVHGSPLGSPVLGRD